MRKGLPGRALPPATVKARLVSHPGGYPLWVLEDGGRPFAIIPDMDGDPAVRRRVAALCHGARLVVPPDQVPEDGGRRWLETLHEQVASETIPLAGLDSAKKAERTAALLGQLFFPVQRAGGQ